MKDGLIYETLHCHTQNSDGSLTHLQVLESCAQNSIGVVAFTDHDTLPSQDQVRQLKAIKDHPVKYVWGIELTSGYPKELSGADPKMFHIVGLFVDPGNGDLKDLTVSIHQKRWQRLNLRVEEFKRLGFTVSLKEVKGTVTKNGVPTSLNLVNVLLSHGENRKILEKYLQKFKKLASSSAALKPLLSEITSVGGSDKQKYYNIFMKDESPLKIKLPKAESLDMDATVSLVRAAGGLAVLAHWSFDRADVTKPLLEKIAREKRLDGLETVYDLFLLNKPFWRRKFQIDRKFLRELTDKYRLFRSGGLDAHRREDFELFAKAKEYNRETIGLTAAIIRGWHPSLEHSSFSE